MQWINIKSSLHRSRQGTLWKLFNLRFHSNYQKCDLTGTQKEETKLFPISA